MPWLDGAELDRLRRMLEYFLLSAQLGEIGPALRWLRPVLRAPLRWRLRKRRLSVPWELWVSRAGRRLIARRSLLTGVSLGRKVREVC